MTRHGTAAGSTLRHRIPAIAWLAMMLLGLALAGGFAALQRVSRTSTRATI